MINSPQRHNCSQHSSEYRWFLAKLGDQHPAKYFAWKYETNNEQVGSTQGLEVYRRHTRYVGNWFRFIRRTQPCPLEYVCLQRVFVLRWCRSGTSWPTGFGVPEILIEPSVKIKTVINRMCNWFEYLIDGGSKCTNRYMETEYTYLLMDIITVS